MTQTGPIFHLVERISPGHIGTDTSIAKLSTGTTDHHDQQKTFSW